MPMWRRLARKRLCCLGMHSTHTDDDVVHGLVHWFGDQLTFIVSADIPLLYIVHDIPSGRSLAFLWSVVCLFVGHSWVYSYHVSFCKISFRLTAGPNSIRLPTICESFSNCQKASAAPRFGVHQTICFQGSLRCSCHSGSSWVDSWICPKMGYLSNPVGK